MNCYYRIADKADSGLECTYPESVILKITDAIGIIGNGSFQYFFECNFDADEISEALAIIGEVEGSEIVLMAKNIFPRGIPQEDLDERLQFMQDHTHDFDQLGKKMMQLEKVIDEKLEKYAVDKKLM